MNDLLMLWRDFFATGGQVLWAIFAVTVGVWWLILDRFWYLRREHPQALSTTLRQWSQRADKRSWYGESLRRQWISQLECAMLRNQKLVPSLIALLPMLGLLGTVTGMIQVFDVLAVTGSSNPRAMADGVSAATVPTMAGMVAALSALPFSARLERRYQRELHRIAEKMPSETE